MRRAGLSPPIGLQEFTAAGIGGSPGSGQGDGDAGGSHPPESRCPAGIREDCDRSTSRVLKMKTVFVKTLIIMKMIFN
jgi:hypothetical protein